MDPPFPQEILEQIMWWAGRQSNYAARVAGLRNQGQDFRTMEDKTLDPQTLREPFTYWDWHGLSEQDWYQGLDVRKERLCHGRQRVPPDQLNIHGFWLGKERWERFKKC